MLSYIKPQPGGAHCPKCGQLTAAYRVLPESHGCRVRYHRCMHCSNLFKSVEKIANEADDLLCHSNGSL